MKKTIYTHPEDCFELSEGSELTMGVKQKEMCDLKTRRCKFHAMH